MSGKYEPPLTVASFATITHSRPSTTPMPGDDAGARRLAVVDVPRGERVQLEERGAGVDEPVDALAREQLPARAVPLDRALAAAGRDQRRALAQLRRRAPPSASGGARSRRSRSTRLWSSAMAGAYAAFRRSTKVTRRVTPSDRDRAGLIAAPSRPVGCDRCLRAARRGRRRRRRLDGRTCPLRVKRSVRALTRRSPWVSTAARRQPR